MRYMLRLTFGGLLVLTALGCAQRVEACPASGTWYLLDAEHEKGDPDPPLGVGLRFGVSRKGCFLIIGHGSDFDLYEGVLFAEDKAGSYSLSYQPVGVSGRRSLGDMRKLQGGIVFTGSSNTSVKDRTLMLRQAEPDVFSGFWPEQILKAAQDG